MISSDEEGMGGKLFGRSHLEGDPLWHEFDVVTSHAVAKFIARMAHPMAGTVIFEAHGSGAVARQSNLRVVQLCFFWLGVVVGEQGRGSALGRGGVGVWA